MMYQPLVSDGSEFELVGLDADVLAYLCRLNTAMQKIAMAMLAAAVTRIVRLDAIRLHGVEWNLD